MSKLIAFGWYGGKYSHLDWLLPLLPETTHYCEPFGGSAAVLLNRKPSPVETYNDIDGEVVNFFRVLRNEQEELIKAIGLTPFSREEIRIATQESLEGISDLERARRFFVRARQVRTGLAQTASEGRWAHCKLTSRAGMAGAVSRWLGSVEGLSEVVQRLLRVQIENAPAVEVIKRFDSDQTLFYCDPPYPHDSRSDTNAYGFEMTDDEHRELAETLHNVQGLVGLSGYHSKLMDSLYKDWDYIESPPKKAHSTNTRSDNLKQNRTEVLWVNYKIPVKKVNEWQNHQKSLMPNRWYRIRNPRLRGLRPTLFAPVSPYAFQLPGSVPIFDTIRASELGESASEGSLSFNAAGGGG